MSRRRPWPIRHKGQAFLLGLTAVGAARQWPTTAAAIAVAATAVAGAWWWARAALRARTGTIRTARGPLDMRPCGVYQHFFAAPNGHVYVGITNHYRARTAQHLEGSWWAAYADWDRSLWQEWTAADCPPGVTPRQMAKAEESRLIALYAPIGNTEENPYYRAQQPIRAQMQAAIGWTPAAAVSPPRRRYTRIWRAA